MGRSRPPTEPPPPAPTGLTPAVPRHGRLVPAPDTPLSECPTNLHLVTPEGKRLAFNAASASDDSVPSAGGPTSAPGGTWSTPPSRWTKTTGELRHFARTVLIDADGRT
jgi:hypothetical protein